MKVNNLTQNQNYNATQMQSERSGGAGALKAAVIKLDTKDGSFFNNSKLKLIAWTVATVGIALLFVLYPQTANANYEKFNSYYEKCNSYKLKHLLCDKKVILNPITYIEKNTNLSIFTNLQVLSEMTTEQQHEVITAFNLQDKVKLLVNDDFFKNLKELDPKILTEIQLVDLYQCSLRSFPLSMPMDCNNSELKYLLMKNEDFSQLTIGNLSNISQKQALAIYSRLGLLNKEPVISENLEKDLLQMPLIKFSCLSGQQLNQLIDKIPPRLFSLLLNEQLNKIDLTKASTAQIDALSNEQISFLSPEKLQAILKVLNDQQIKSISYNQFKQLKLRGLLQHQLGILSQQKFDVLFGNDENGNLFGWTRARSLFELLSGEQVNSILPKLSGEMLRYLLTQEQFQKLDLKALSQQQFDVLFGNDGNGNLFGWSRAERLFKLLSGEQVNSTLPKLSGETLSYLVTDAQFRQLNLEELTILQMNKLLYIYKHRITFLTINHLNSIIDQLDDQLVASVSDAQLKLLDTSKLTREKVDMIFPVWTLEKLRSSHSGITDGYLDGCLDGYLTTLGNEIKEENRRKLSLLSDVQVKSIYKILAEENQALVRQNQSVAY